MDTEIPDWYERASALGHPVYGVPEAEPRDTGASWRGDISKPYSVNLTFGRWGRRLVVETSLEEVNDDRMLMDLLLGWELTYPLCIHEGNCAVLVDGVPFEFRLLFLDEADDNWCGVAVVSGRWIYLRSMGVPRLDITLDSIAL